MSVRMKGDIYLAARCPFPRPLIRSIPPAVLQPIPRPSYRANNVTAVRHPAIGLTAGRSDDEVPDMVSIVQNAHRDDSSGASYGSAWWNLCQPG